MFGGGAPKCKRCAKSVYAAEEVLGAGAHWHPQCFTCKNCNTRLSSTTLTEKEDEIYCQGCYAKKWGPKGFGIGGHTTTTGVSVSDGAASASSPSSGMSAGGKSFCTSCGTAASQAGQKFCGSCGKPMSSSGGAASSPPAAASSPPPAAAPRPSPSSGPSAAAKWSGAAAKSPITGLGGGERCTVCNERVYEAEKVQGGGKSFHQSCFRCTTCRAGLSSTNLNDAGGKLYCNACYAKNFGPKGYGFGGGGASTFAYTQ